MYHCVLLLISTSISRYKIDIQMHTDTQQNLPLPELMSTLCCQNKNGATGKSKTAWELTKSCSRLHKLLSRRHIWISFENMQVQSIFITLYKKQIEILKSISRIRPFAPRTSQFAEALSNYYQYWLHQWAKPHIVDKPQQVSVIHILQ